MPERTRSEPDLAVPTTPARATRVMSDFFSPLEEDVVRRTRQDEDEERLAEEALDAVGDRARVFALWNEETRDAIERGALKPTTLLVATTPWACGLVFDTVEAGAARLRPMGTITVAGVSARGIAASGTIGREDPVGTLFQTEAIEKQPRRGVLATKTFAS